MTPALQALRLAKGQLYVSMTSASGVAIDGTGVQLQGVLDDLVRPGRGI